MGFVLFIGLFAGRGSATADDLYRGGRRVPAWAIGISVLATSLSGVTFIGGPQQAYLSDLTYLSASIATVIAAVLVAWLFLPKYFAANAATVYEVIGDRRGVAARRACAVMFLFGRLLASGVRVYVAAIAMSMIFFGDLDRTHLVICIAVFATAALIYTSWGGIKAVIWTDTLQAIVLVVAVVGSILVLTGQIELPFSAAKETLDDAQKLTLFDLSFDFSSTFSLWSVLIGWTLFNAASLGTDQDMAQRLFTSPSPKHAAGALIGSQIAAIFVVSLFMTVGLMLFVRDANSAEGLADGTRRVFLSFILSDLPVGLRGLLIAGLFAAAMSSMDSTMASMSSALVLDLGLGSKSEADGAKVARIGNFLVGVGLSAFAIVFAIVAAGEEEGIIPFALGVMTYAYAGLLAVFVCVLLLDRGSPATIIAALATGAVTVHAMKVFSGTSIGWWMLVAFSVSLLVAASVPAPPRQGAKQGAEVFPVGDAK
jgi:SSS family transporter